MIHREGWVTIVLSLIILIPICIWAKTSASNYIFIFVLILSLFLFVIVLQFFRNPKRQIPLVNDKLIYAPADGKVVVIEEAFEKEYFSSQMKQISIFMSPLNVHANRIPCSGEIIYDKPHKGKYLAAWNPKSSEENERATIVIETPNGKMLLKQVAGALARRIKYYVKKGDKVQQGQEYGFIKFGSRVDIFIPINAEILVNLEDNVKGNLDVIAKFI